MWLSVWNFDAFGRNVFLGEIRLPLSTLDVNGDHPFWYPLNNKVSNFYVVNFDEHSVFT